MSGDYIKSFCTSPPTLRFLFIKLKVIKIQVKEKEREKKNMKGIKPSWTERSCSKKKSWTERWDSIMSIPIFCLASPITHEEERRIWLISWMTASSIICLESRMWRWGTYMKLKASACRLFGDIAEKITSQQPFSAKIAWLHILPPFLMKSKYIEEQKSPLLQIFWLMQTLSSLFILIFLTSSGTEDVEHWLEQYATPTYWPL